MTHKYADGGALSADTSTRNRDRPGEDQEHERPVIAWLNQVQYVPPPMSLDGLWTTRYYARTCPAFAYSEDEDWPLAMRDLEEATEAVTPPEVSDFRRLLQLLKNRIARAAGVDPSPQEVAEIELLTELLLASYRREHGEDRGAVAQDLARHWGRHRSSDEAGTAK